MDTPDTAMGPNGEIDVTTYKQLVNLELAKRRVLLCFFDESDRKVFSATENGVLSALYQEAGPILLSTSLLKRIIEISNSDARSTEDLKNFLRLDDGYNEKEENVLVPRLCFKPEKWIIKKVNHALSIMISKKQLKSFDIDWNNANEYVDADIVSDSELRLGLRLNHLKTIDIDDIIQREIKEKGAGCSADEIKALFCKKQDYISRNMAIPEWYIVMDGHGSLTLRVAGMPLENFQNLLNFFSSYINTHMVCVKSCYTLGANAKKIYEETPFGLQKQYPFAIIAFGFNDTITTSQGLRPKLYNPEEVEVVLDCDAFLQLIGKLDIDYDKVAKIFSSGKLENTPQIKFPGMEWFSVMDVDKKTVSIGSILAQTRDSQKPLDIAARFKKDPVAILLRTDDIPFELKLTGLKNVESIISMVSSGPMVENPDLVVHRIKKISLPEEKTALEGLQLFTSIADVKGSKMLFVEEFETKKNLVIFGLPTSPGIKIVKAYFEDSDENGFVVEFQTPNHRRPIVAKEFLKDSADEQDYLRKIKLATIDYPQAKEANTIKRVTHEQIKKIHDVYSEQHIVPGPRGKRMYEKLEK